jgi:DNA polymerase-3 subunit delta'
LAQSLLCESQQGHLACGVCAACKWFEHGNHPDYRELLPESLSEDAEAEEASDADEKDKKKSREIKIDQVRAIADFMTLSTHRDGWRVLVVHPAESMNAAAANALLKTLEEPAPRSVIVLVTGEMGRLLATIRSRCQRVRLPMPSADVASSWLRAKGVHKPDDALAAAGGAPIDALAFAHPDYQSARSAFLAALGEPGFDFVLTAQNFEKADLPVVLGWLQAWVGDLILCRMTGAVHTHRDHARAITALAGQCTPRKLFRFEAELRQTRRLINHPLNARLLLEQLFIAYKQAIQR